MDDRVGIAEALAELLAHRHLADHRFVHGVHHDEVVGVDGARAGAGPAAQRVHRRERIGAELDARADFADLGGLLQHDDVEASLVEAERARHAADAAAHHDDGVVLVAAHPWTLPHGRAVRARLYRKHTVCMHTVNIDGSGPAPPHDHTRRRSSARLISSFSGSAALRISAAWKKSSTL